MNTMAAVLLFLLATGGAQDLPGARRAFSIAPVRGTIVVDGRLDDEGWKEAVQVDLQFETSPGSNTPARVATLCRIGIDDRALYFGCEAREDQPGGIRAYYTDRDQTASQDRVGLSLDTDGGARSAFVFSVSPLGVQSDAIFDQERQSESPEWDAIWSSAGRITGDGYTVEAAIPLRALRFRAGTSPQTWGFYFWRSRPRSESAMFRSTPDDPRSNCALCTAGRLTGFMPGRSAGTLDFTPTLSLARSDRWQPHAGLEAGVPHAEAGLDARWAVTSGLSLNVTLNPDFSQVEADVAELDVNTRFALSYAEKRPFFLEGRELFQTPIPSVYTRTIADPAAGVKLSGRVGPTGMGFIIARDEVTNVLRPHIGGSQVVSLAGGTTTAIARVRRDFGDKVSVGGLFTGRSGTSYSNRLGGVDAVVRPLPSLTLSGQVQTSRTEDPTSDGGTAASAGASAYARATYLTRDWNVETSYERTSPEFRADAGFVGQVGYSQRRVTARRTFWVSRRPWITNVVIAAAHWPLDDPDGRLFTRWQYVAVDYHGPWQSRAAFYARWRSERFLGTQFEFYTPYYGFELRPNGAVSMVLNITGGQAIAYAHAALADSQDIRPEVNFQVGRHVSGQVRHARQRLASPSGLLLSADLTQGRLAYSLNARTLVRTVIQRRHTWERTLSGGSTSTTSLLTQVLLSYKVNPQTVFFGGYSDSFRDLEEGPVPNGRLERISRTFFLKLGYAFRP